MFSTAEQSALSASFHLAFSSLSLLASSISEKSIALTDQETKS